MKKLVSRGLNMFLATILVVAAMPLFAMHQVLAAPDVVDIWHGNYQVFGDKGNPQKWVNILGRADTTVTQLSYRLNGSASRALTIGPDNRRLAMRGDFNVDIDKDLLNAGQNTVSITAIDQLAGAVTEDVIVEYVPNKIWPLPYTADWSTATKISDRAQVVDGEWSLTGGGLRSVVPDYDRTVAIGDITWRDYEVTVPVTINRVDFAGAGSSESGLPGVGFIMRWAGHTDKPVANKQPKAGWEPNGALGWWRWTSQTAAKLQYYGGSGKSFTPVAGTTYMLKQRAQTQGDGSTVYNMKAWVSGQPEPSAWMLKRTVSAAGMPAGSVLLVAHHVDATYGAVSITPLGTQAPTLHVSAGSDVTANVDASVSLAGNVTYTGSGQPTVSWTKVSGPGTVSFANAASPSTQVQATAAGTYVLRLTASAGSLTASDDTTLTVTTLDSNPPASLLDTFNSTTLGSDWTFVNPLNDSNYSLTNSVGHLQINVGAGRTHDCWKTTPNCVRMMRAAMGDGTYETKIDNSPLASKYQTYGMILAQDNLNYLRFEFHYNGAGTYIKAYKITTAGSSEVLAGPQVALSASNSLRVTKQGTSYTVSYRLGDSGTWLTAGTFTLSGVQLNQVGMHVINSSLNAATTANIDYFSYTP